MVTYCYRDSSNLKVKVQKPKENPSNPFPSQFPPNPILPPKTPFTPPNIQVPVEREDINSQLTLEQRKNNQKLSIVEEKCIIEILQSQVNIDKNKTFFDYRWGFNMVPGVREIFDDQDEALYLFTDKGKFFVKINNYSDLARFEWEKESMLAINEAVPGLAPYPFCWGNLPRDGKFLVVNFLEGPWHDRLVVENQKSLAKSLFQLHQKKSPNGKFGFHIGKNNEWKDNWLTFFQENRWQSLWKRVCEKNPHDEELKKWGTIIGEKVIPNLLGNLVVEPVLLHGNLDFDAWDINPQTKQPWVFDTHYYYGHSEMDLSLIHYFWPPGKIPGVTGCEGKFFETEFWDEYQKHHPLPPGFSERRDLYRLYDYLHRKTARNRKLTTEPKFYKKILTMMKKLGKKYDQ